MPGTRHYGGRLHVDTNFRLRGARGVEYLEKMARGDAVCRDIVDGNRRTARTVTWAWKTPVGKEGSKKARRAARFANEAWARIGWDEYVAANAIRYVSFGWRYGEESFERGPDARGVERVWLKGYADREPTAHQDWVLNEAGTELEAVTQCASTGFMLGNTTPIPANRIVIFTSGGVTGTNFEGDGGVLRACYNAFRHKKHAEDMRGAAADRIGAPALQVEADYEVMHNAQMGPDEIAQAVEQAQESAKNYTAGDGATLFKCKGITYSLFGEGFDPSGLNSIASQANTEMRAAAARQFAGFGDGGSTGSHAQFGNSLSQFELAMVDRLQHIADQVSGRARPGGGTMGRLMAWNFPDLPLSLHPRLTFAGLRVDPLLKALGTLPHLQNTGVLTFTNRDENEVRDVIGLPQLAPDAERTAEERRPVASIADDADKSPTGGEGPGRGNEQPKAPH